MSKTIKITDLQMQQSQMQTMANELESAKQLIVKSIKSMRNAGIDSISPLGTAKLNTLLTVIKTQNENLEIGIQVLQHSLDSMQNVDLSLRKIMNDGKIGNSGIPGWNKPSNQVVEDDRLKVDISAKAKGGYDINLFNEDGSINGQAFNQSNEIYKYFKYGDEENDFTGMENGGCNHCANAYALVGMGFQTDPIDMYYNGSGPMDANRCRYLNESVVEKHFGVTKEQNLGELDRYLSESIDNPSMYSKPVVRLASYSFPYGDKDAFGRGTHYVTVVGYTTDANGNQVYEIFDPGDGQKKPLSVWNPEIVSCVRYKK